MRSTETRLRTRISIALRMTIWYSITSFILIFAVSGLLYEVLVTNLYQEDVRDLADNLNNARLVWGASPPARLATAGERPRWAPAGQPEIYLRVLNQNAQNVVETPGMSAELPLPAAAELAPIKASEGERRAVQSRSGRPFLSLIAPIRRGAEREPAYYIQVAMDRTHDESLLSRYRAWLLAVLGLSIVACSAIGYLIARGGMRPIEDISRMTERIRSTTLYERLPTEDLPAELFGLAAIFNGMLNRLQESFSQISQFSNDVAHELRTPISNLRGEIEVALSKARSNEEYRETLGSSLEECARITRIIDSLLFLAREEQAPQLLDRGSVDVARELESVREFYEAAAQDAGVELRLSVDADLYAPLDRTLFQHAVGNIVSNAIEHTPRNGAVDITARNDKTALQVTVSDTGCGIASEHLPRIFDRFYRVDRARSGSSDHLGLGLALVKSIVERHSGTVSIDSEPDRGTRVTLAFPRIARRAPVTPHEPR